MGYITSLLLKDFAAAIGYYLVVYLIGYENIE
jgi:hypothetical protein